MRAFEFLIEKLVNQPVSNDPKVVQSKIQSRISRIFDIKELNQILSYVGKVDLGKGFDEIFARDPDLRSVQSTVAHAIVNSTASLDDKLMFAKELVTNGIIDVQRLMKPGVTQNVVDLVVTDYPEIYQDIAPTLMSIAGKFQVKDKTLNRGKGEFFLALLSPEISIGGVGDITISGEGYEVKDNEGRMYGSSDAFGKVEPGKKAAEKTVVDFVKSHKLDIDPSKIKVAIGPKSNLYSIGPTIVQKGVNHAEVRKLVETCMVQNITSLYTKMTADEIAGFTSSIDGNGVVNWDQFMSYLKVFIYGYYQREAQFTGMFLFNSKKMTVTFVNTPEMFAQMVKITHGFYGGQQQGVQVYTP